MQSGGEFSSSSCHQTSLDLLIEEFREEDVVVVIFHDHGSRYVGKIYNDDWMRDRQFIPAKEILAADIIQKKSLKEFISIAPEDSLKNAIEVMQSNDISQLPVLYERNVVGAITEHLILKSMFNSKGTGLKVEDVIE